MTIEFKTTCSKKKKEFKTTEEKTTKLQQINKDWSSVSNNNNLTYLDFN